MLAKERSYLTFITVECQLTSIFTLSPGSYWSPNAVVLARLEVIVGAALRGRPRFGTYVIVRRAASAHTEETRNAGF